MNALNNRSNCNAFCFEIFNTFNMVKASLFSIFLQTEIHTMNTPIAEAHLIFMLAFVYLIAHSRLFNFYAWNFVTPELNSK